MHLSYYHNYSFFYTVVTRWNVPTAPPYITNVHTIHHKVFCSLCLLNACDKYSQLSIIRILIFVFFFVCQMSTKMNINTKSPVISSSTPKYPSKLQVWVLLWTTAHWNIIMSLQKPPSNHFACSCRSCLPSENTKGFFSDFVFSIFNTLFVSDPNSSSS